MSIALLPPRNAKNTTPQRLSTTEHESRLQQCGPCCYSRDSCLAVDKRGGIVLLAFLGGNSAIDM